jgi:hypothetical protein
MPSPTITKETDYSGTRAEISRVEGTKPPNDHTAGRDFGLTDREHDDLKPRRSSDFLGYCYLCGEPTGGGRFCRRHRWAYGRLP